MGNFEVDLSEDEVIQPVVKEVKSPKKKQVKEVVEEDEAPYNPLRNEKIIVRYLPKRTGIWGNNPKHVLAGGMAETATKVFVVPRLSSGAFVNILTDKEKKFLENALGLEDNAMSIYNKKDNFWSDANPNGINMVRLRKQDNYLDLRDPADYIRYKILLANKDFIAPSQEILENKYKATYQYVLISTNGETEVAKSRMNTTMTCYKEFGKIENDLYKLRIIVEALDGRPTADSVKLDFLQVRCNDLIQHDAKAFLKVLKDEYLDTKVLIRKAQDTGIIVKRGNYYYYKSGSETIPLCNNNEEPTYNIAARFLNTPKNQELKFSIEAKLN